MMGMIRFLDTGPQGANSPSAIYELCEILQVASPLLCRSVFRLQNGDDDGNHSDI